jgi:hypothetical protein
VADEALLYGSLPEGLGLPVSFGMTRPQRSRKRQHDQDEYAAENDQVDYEFDEGRVQGSTSTGKPSGPGDSGTADHDAAVQSSLDPSLFEGIPEGFDLPVSFGTKRARNRRHADAEDEDGQDWNQEAGDEAAEQADAGAGKRKPLSKKGRDYEVPEDIVAAGLQKYFAQRHTLFSLFSKGIKLDLGKQLFLGLWIFVF